MAYDKGKSGISVYINETIKALAQNHKLTILILESDHKIFPVKNPNIEFKIFPDSLAPALKNMLWHLFVLPGKLNFNEYDFLFLPAGNRRLFYKFPIFSIATLHDLSQYHIQGKYDSFRMFYIKKVVPFFLKKAAHIMCVSKSTLNDAVKYYKIPQDKLSVNYNGYDKDTYHCKLDLNPKILEKYGIRENYILYISRIEYPGKNHLNLIKAYELLPESIKNKFSLVLGGSFWPGSEIVKEYAEKSPDAEKIRFIGFVPTDDLPTLYTKSNLYVFPSFFEGFGLSLVEAMACGTPIICSDRSSLPEVGGDASLLFDPDDPTQIAKVIEKVLASSQLQEDMKAKGFERLSMFDWQLHAQKLVEIYEENKIK